MSLKTTALACSQAISPISNLEIERLNETRFMQERRIEAKEILDPLELSPAVSEAAKKSLGRAAKACRQIGWFSFWTQLSLSIVSAGIMLFSVAFTSQVAHVSAWLVCQAPFILVSSTHYQQSGWMFSVSL